MSVQLLVNGGSREVNSFVYSGGEVSVKIKGKLHADKGEYISIHATLHSSADIVELLMVTDAVRRDLPLTPLILTMPYCPYARQDRVCAPGEALSIKVFCDLINSQNYSKVIVEDPHSDVLVALINNCRVRTQAEVFNPMIEVLGRNRQILVSPDAGANKKIFELAKTYCFTEVVRADKTRNVETGAITGTVVYSEHVGDKDFLIVDDICDGGYTFIKLAEALKTLTTGKVILYVTHGIFSKGLDVFKGLIDEVYCARPFNPEYPPYTNLMK
jgi:ribose-phosphate pyrophosphokinase